MKYTTRWIINQIILHLQSFINYKCVHRKFGTIIFRKGGDILTSLSWAIGRMQLKDSEDAILSIQTSIATARVKLMFLGKLGT